MTTCSMLKHWVVPGDFDSSIAVELETLRLTRTSLQSAPSILIAYLHKSICNKLERFPISLGRESKSLPATMTKVASND